MVRRLVAGSWLLPALSPGFQILTGISPDGVTILLHWAPKASTLARHNVRGERRDEGRSRSRNLSTNGRDTRIARQARVKENGS